MHRFSKLLILLILCCQWQQSLANQSIYTGDNLRYGQEKSSEILTNPDLKLSQVYADVFLILDLSPIHSWPSHFRTSKGWFAKHQHSCLPFSLDGFKELQISASGQFTPHQLDNMLLQFEGDVYVVDLRNESHGFISDIPVSWYGPQNGLNTGLTPADIHLQESELLSEVRRYGSFLGYKALKKSKGFSTIVTSAVYPVQGVRSEQELVSDRGLSYERFYVVDHAPPGDQEVDRFVAFVRSIPKGTWVHFHCRAGKGRSSTFMIMYDIIRNAHRVSLEDIVARHMAIGSKDILNLKLSSGSVWKQPKLQLRKQFIEAFYQYIQSTQEAGAMTWSQWRNLH